MFRTGLALLITLAACKRAAEPAPAPAPAPPPDASSPVDAPASDAGDGASPTLRIGPVTMKVVDTSKQAPGLTTRCSIGGDPLNGDYRQGDLSLVAQGDALVVCDGQTVRRYRRAEPGDGSGCALELDPRFGAAGILTPPDRAANPQRVGGGTMYLSSGADWRVSAGEGGAIYLTDFTRGVYRVDRGKVEPVCPELSGVLGVAAIGGTLYAARDGGSRLALPGCKVTPKVLAERVIRVYALDALYGVIDFNVAARFDRRGAVVARFGGDDHFKPGGLCAIGAIAACGDAVCILDHNCPRIERFAPDGTFRDQLEADQLFTDRPYGVTTLASARDGLWIGAVHKDGATAEAAIYWLPASAFAAD